MRQANRERLEPVRRTVPTQPGIRPAALAGAMGLPRSPAARLSPPLKDAGLLPIEDSPGFLWSWDGRLGR